MKKYLVIFLLMVSPVFGIRSIINAFNAGELSPLLRGRTDIAKYYSGAQTLENFLVLSYGGVTRRPGTAFIASAKNPDEEVRLIPFEFSAIQAYILEFGDEYIRFYRDGGQILDEGLPYEISSPYDTDAGTNLLDIQFVQSADTMYIVHPDYAPRTLTRTGHTSWVLAEITFSRGPFLRENFTSTTITPSNRGGTITLTASSAIFNANHIGALWRLTHTVDGVNESGSFSNSGSEQNSSSVTVQLGRSWRFTTHATWSGDLVLQRSFDSGVVWKDVVPVHYESDGNILDSGTEVVDDAIYRVHAEAGAAGIDSGTCNFNFTALSFDVEGVVEIKAFTDSMNVTAFVVNALGDTAAITTWSEGAWSFDEGYPSVISFYEERSVYAATDNSPQTIWMSATDDWANFLTGSEADRAFSRTIASDQVNVIRWLAPRDALMVGTIGGEWKMWAPGADEPIHNGNAVIRKQSSYGSANIQPAVVDNAILFVERQAKKVRELVYVWDSDSWQAPDMTVLSEHIADSGIKQIAFQRTPDPILWAVTVDGDLIGLTYNRPQDVIAWHNHTLTGDVESVAVIPGDGEDEVWVLIEREINGSTVRYIEQFGPRDWGDQDAAFMVDSGLSFDGGSAISITNVTQADPAVVTAAAHGFSDGQQVRIFDVDGMAELNEIVFSVSSPATNTFELRDSTDTVDIDSSSFTTYTENGSVFQVENTFDTLTHLEGVVVDIVGEGGFVGTERVTNSTIILDDFYNTVHAGIGYDAKLLPMGLEIPGQQSQARTKRIIDVSVRLFESLGCEIGTSFTETDPLIFRESTDLLEAATPLFTGDKNIDFDGDFETEGNIYVLSDKPLPLTVLAIIPEWEIYR